MSDQWKKFAMGWKGPEVWPESSILDAQRSGETEWPVRLYGPKLSFAANKVDVARNLSYNTGEAHKEVERLEKMDDDSMSILQLAEAIRKECLSSADGMVLCGIKVVLQRLSMEERYLGKFRRLGLGFTLAINANVVVFCLTSETSL
uniref:Uncharacterized protein n=1 Tax=Tanacetum cinerariifolium TaxID=118510 RepID=A0A6L2LI02_TANCI|nr:hypothetical protein [Tanacetum cinerariifolium]